MNASANQYPGVVVHTVDDHQNPSQGSSNDQPQQSKQHNSGENEQAHTGADSPQQHPPAQASASVVLSELALHRPRRPAGGFADDDPATANMVAILQSLEAQPPTPTAVRDIILLPTTNPNKRRFYPFEQLLRRRMTDGANYNFFLPFPYCQGDMMGKVDFSETGLTIITESMRAVVRGYGETMPVAPLGQHLNAADDVARFVRPRELDQIHYSNVCPFTPGGIRTVAAILQAALRRPGSEHALFYAHGVTDPSLKRRLVVCIKVHPIVGWRN